MRGIESSCGAADPVPCWISSVSFCFKSHVEVPTDIAPSGDKSTLTLSDGRVVELDSVGQGSIPNQ